jgi:hypothetical protein
MLRQDNDKKYPMESDGKVKLVLVDANDRVVGYREKLKVS